MRALTVYYEHRPGGMMQMIYRMLLGCAERGGEMHYVAVEPYRVEHPRLHPHLLPAPRRHDSLLFWLWFFAAAPLLTLLVAWRRGVDLLAVFEGVYAWVALPAKILLRLPMVVFLQSDVATINRMHRRHPLLRRVEQWMEGSGLRRAERIVATNRGLADLVRQRWNLPAEKIEVVPNNVPAADQPSAAARERLRAEIGLPAGAFAIATSGVFSPRKNLPLLLEAFSEAAAPSAHLIVIGEGPEAAAWENTVDAARRAPNGERIHFLGWRGDVVAVLAGCDLFVLPSRHEGSPLSLIEALRVGLPCLGSDVDEIREVLGDDPACLFGPDDSAALQARIEELAADPQSLARLRELAAERAKLYEFDWEGRVMGILESGVRRNAPLSVPPRIQSGVSRRTPESLLVRLYERTTGTRATARSAAVVQRFGPYLAGMVAAKGLSTLGQLLISRMLGPGEVGRLAVVLSASTLIALPLAGAWGSTFVRYAAGTSGWAPLLHATSRRVLGGALALAAAVAVLSPLAAPLLDVPPGLLAAGAFLGVAMAAWLLAKAALQAREDWRRFVASELGFGAMTCALPVVCVLFASSVPCAPAGWGAAAALFALAYAVGVLPAWRRLAAAARVPAAVEPTASRFARFALLTGASNTIFLYTDRFAAQRVLGFSEVGVYHVYSVATVGVAMLASTLLYNFAFPLFPQGDRVAFARVFRGGFVRLLPLTLAGIFAAGAAQIAIAGFPFRPELLVLASLSAAAFLFSGFYGHLVLSLGVNGSQVAARVAGLTLVVYLVAVVPAVKVAGLAGLFGLYTLIYIGVAVYYARALQRLAPEPADAEAVAPQAL